MRVRFWGTRGSIAKPGPDTLRYGGNTSCVEVRADDGTLVVLDCGTGAHALGRLLATDATAPQQGHLLIGHTHWDHIQGFPFFEPLFVAGRAWEIYAPGGRGRQLEATLAGQMAYEYSPITLESLDADYRLHDLREGMLDVGGIRVTAQYLNHPALTLGYRLEADGATLVYATDHEPYTPHLLDSTPGAVPLHREDRRHIRFLEEADLLIHDAQYTADQFPEKAGWGHTSVETAVDYAILARVARLALFHHDPDRSDDEVEAILEGARARARAGDHQPDVLAAAESQVIELPRRAGRAQPPIAATESALLPVSAPLASTVLIVEDDPEMLALLKAALHSEQVRVLTARDCEPALRIAEEETPSLILLDLKLPSGDGLEICRRLRKADDPRLREAPILVLTGLKLGASDLDAAFAAGATDYLTKPIKPTLVRSRVRSWLLRASA